MASYIHILESAGARTVPLIFDGDLTEELSKLDNLNGVFFCGGGASGAYDVFGQAVYDRVKELNDQGKYLPAWGTCLGFEDLAMYSTRLSKSKILKKPFDADDENYKLEFLVDPSDTRVFGPLKEQAHVFEQ